MPLVNRGNHCSVRRRRLRSRNRPKPSVTPFDHFGAAEERSEGRGAGEERRGASCGRAGGRAGERLHGFRPASPGRGRPPPSTAAWAPFASPAIGALSRRPLAHFPAIGEGSAAVLPPPACARRAFLLPPPATVENLPFPQLLIRSPTATSTTATVRRSLYVSSCK